MNQFDLTEQLSWFEETSKMSQDTDLFWAKIEKDLKIKVENHVKNSLK